MMGTLYLVPTPLGNLEDITLRALRILKEVDLIATEDTRTTGRLLKHFEVDCPMLSYHEHTKEARVEHLLQVLESSDVALVSEAGTPLLSDPGYKLVRSAIEQGIDVVSLPGPSAITTALAASGLAVDRFTFLGFPPRKSGARRQFLSEIASLKNTLIFFESPHRLRITLADMMEILGADRPLTICRELTKLHEELWRGTLTEAIQTWQTREPRGEFTLVVSGAPAPPVWNKTQVERVLADLLSAGSGAKAAAQAVATQSGWSKKKVYTLALQVKDDDTFKK